MLIYKKYITILAAFVMILFMTDRAALAQTDRAALAQTDGVTVISIAGKAEILEQGRRTPAREGHRLLPGQSVRLVGGGEVRLSTTDGRIQVRVLDNTTLKYDGPAGANSLPWTPASQYQRASSAEERKVPQMSVPVGRLEVEVQPGQELRLVMPLIMAAVRGTRFTVSVDLDGTSRVNTFDGAVAAYGRNGEFRLTLAGQTAEVTARAYVSFLAAQGVSAPGGNWKNVPPRTQERVDNSVIGPVFGEGGGDLLVAVLANPNASPTSGVNALAVETAAAGTGSLFAESSEGSNLGGGASSGLASQGGSGGILPDSTLLDQGLPDIDSNIPHSSTHSGPIAHFIGSFAYGPSVSTAYFNKMVFDIDLSSGQIFDAAFDIEYFTVPYASYSSGAQHQITANGGTGYVSMSSLGFNISNFTSSYFHEDDSMSAAYGTLGAGTTMSGSFMGPVNFGGIGQGSLTPQYDIASGTNYGLPTYVNFSGSLETQPLVDVTGRFLIPTGATESYNTFEFALNLNTGQIFDGYADIGYYDTSSNQVRVFLQHGSGSISSGNLFGLGFSSGTAVLTPYSLSSVIVTASGTMSGSFDRAPEVGARVVPGGTVSLSYGPGTLPGFEPSALTVADGVLTKAGL